MSKVQPDLESILSQKIKILDSELGSLDLTDIGKDIVSVIPDILEIKILKKQDLIDQLMFLQDYAPEGYVTRMRTQYRNLGRDELQKILDDLKRSLPKDFDKKIQQEEEDKESYYSSDDPIIINTREPIEFISAGALDELITTTTTLPPTTTEPTTTTRNENIVIIPQIQDDSPLAPKKIVEIVDKNRGLTISIYL